MASRRTPLAPRNVDFPLGKMKTQKTPKSLVPPMDRADLLALLIKINNTYCNPAVQVNIVERDLTHPTPESVEMIYLMLLNAMFNIMPSSLNQMPFSTSITHPELYEGFPYVINVLRILRFVFDSCILPEHDFNPYDLTEPSPKRTQHFFTAIVNYIRFTQYMNKECRADEFMDKTTKDMESLQEFQKKNTELTEQIEHLRRQKIEENQLEDELKKQISVAEKGYHEFQEYQVSGERKLEDCKQENMAARKKLEFVTEEFKNVNSRLEELKLQVVGSPEELEEKLVSLDEELDEIRSVHEECLANHNMWENLCTIADNTSPSVNSIKDDAYELIDQANLLNAKVLEYETSKDTIAKWRRSFKECMVKKQNLVRHLKTIHEERARVEMMPNTGESVNLEIEQEINVLRQKLEEKVDSDRKKAEKVEDIELKLKKVHEQSKLVSDKFNTTTTRLKEMTEAYQAKVETVEEKTI